MILAHAYPPELTEYVLSHWPSGIPLHLTGAQLLEVLSQAYQASMMTEETRPTRFRLLLCPARRLPEDGEPSRGVLRLRFDYGRVLSADELRRLAPAAPFESSLIGVNAEEEKPRIWGIAHSGPAWLAPAWGGRSQVPIWSTDPIVHVTGPGHLAVRSGGRLIGALERGALLDTAMDVFDSEWLPALFAEERARVQEIHAKERPSASAIESSLVGLIAQQMLRRTIQLIRGSQHGGMVLIADANQDGAERLTALHIKYPVQQDEPARRFRTLLFRIVAEVATGSPKAVVGWDDFVAGSSPDLERLEQAVFELSRAFASFSAIDGAVVLNKRFELIGFGAEVSAELPSPLRVCRALDVEGERRVAESVESVGTRHRAAYRFVRDHPRGMAIVVSHDGAVRFVAARGEDVVFWEQSVSP